jgi:hypothetical protein
MNHHCAVAIIPLWDEPGMYLQVPVANCMFRYTSIFIHPPLLYSLGTRSLVRDRLKLRSDFFSISPLKVRSCKLLLTLK